MRLISMLLGFLGRSSAALGGAMSAPWLRPAFGVPATLISGMINVVTFTLDELGTRYTGLEGMGEETVNLHYIGHNKPVNVVPPQAFSGVRTLSIRRGAWKYIDQGEMRQYALLETAPDAPGQLYDLAADPGETTNLFQDKPEIVKELQALLKESKASGRSRPERRRSFVRQESFALHSKQ